MWSCGHTTTGPERISGLRPLVRNKVPAYEEELDDEGAGLGVCPHCAASFDYSDLDEEPDDDDDSDEESEE